MTETETASPPDGAKETRRATWIRGAIMLLFLAAFSLAQTLLAVLAVVQFGFLLITGRENPHIVTFGRSLAIWLAEVAAFQTAATETRPFPFSAWPKVD